MGLAITEEHQALAAVVRSFAADQRVRSGARAALDADAPAVPETWKRIGDLGWLSLHLSEQAGGSGFGLPELAVVVDELGHAITPGPLLATATASAVLSATGGDSLHEFVTRLGNGSAVAGLGLTAGLTRDDDGAYSGELTVLAGRWADVLLLAAGDDLLMAPTTDAAVDVVPVKGLDPSLGLAKVSVTGLVPADGHVLAGALGPAVAVFRTLAAAEAAGGARGCLDLALDYAKVREQFGRPIGMFQAVKHHCADMLVAVELATALAWDAARGAATPAEAELAAAAAAGLAMRSYQRVRAEGHPGPRRHRLHLGARRPPLPAARGGAPGRGGRPGLGRGDVTSHPRRRTAAVRGRTARRGRAYRAEARAFLDRYRAAPEAERRALLVSSGYVMPHWPEPCGRGRGRGRAARHRAGVRRDRDALAGHRRLGAPDAHPARRTRTRSSGGSPRACSASCSGASCSANPTPAPTRPASRTRADTRRRRLAGQRPEGVDQRRAGLQPGPRDGAHRPRTRPSTAGITTMVVDITRPGVEVRPLREITGERAVQRGLLRRRVRPRRRRRRRRAAAGRSPGRRSATSA